VLEIISFIIVLAYYITLNTPTMPCTKLQSERRSPHMLRTEKSNAQDGYAKEMNNHAEKCQINLFTMRNFSRETLVHHNYRAYSACDLIFPAALTNCLSLFSMAVRPSNVCQTW
jgi:hypothetical protein